MLFLLLLLLTLINCRYLLLKKWHPIVYLNIFIRAFPIKYEKYDVRAFIYILLRVSFYTDEINLINVYNNNNNNNNNNNHRSLATSCSCFLDFTL